MRNLLLAILLIGCSTVVAQETQSQLVEIGASPHLASRHAAWAFQSVMEVLQYEICSAGDTLHVTNSLTLERVASITLNEKFKGKSCSSKFNKWKAQLHKEDIARIASFFKTVKDTDDDGAVGEIGIPSFLGFVSRRSLQYPDHKKDIVLLGSAVHIDTKATGFSTLETFPSDGHLKNPLSVFSVRGKESLLKDVTVHLVHPPMSYYNDIHRDKLRRFWALYIQMQGGRLVSFSEDNRVSDRIRTPPLPPIEAAYNQADDKPVMYSVRRRRVDLWEDLPEHTPPATDDVGALVIGIRWSASCPGCDLDLYSGFTDGGVELSYKRPSAPFGVHIKDFLTDSEEYETIEYHRPVNIRDITAAVNIYRAKASRAVSGDVRVIYAGQVYGSSFSMPAQSGNGGATGPGQESFWTRLNLVELVGLE